METDKKIIIRTIEPKEWEDTHILAHEKINSCLVSLWEYVNNIIWELNTVNNFSNKAAEETSAAVSELEKTFSKKIWQIKEQLNEFNETLGSMAEQIKKLKDKSEQWRKYLVKHFEWILDTDTESLATLETIELDWTYLVNIVENETVWNPEVASYSLWRTAIANKEYTPWVYLLSKWWHAVLEYDFTVILTEI